MTRPVTTLARLVLLSSLVMTGCHGIAQTPTAPTFTQVAAGIALSAQPSAVFRSGSDTTISVRVTDTIGDPIVGAPVRLTTTAGTIQATATTGDAGIARVTFSGSSSATVRASVENGAAGSLAIQALAPFSLAFASGTPAPSTSTTWRGVLTLTQPTTIANPPPPTRIVASCGNGTPEQAIDPFVGDWFVPCAFTQAGSYTVSVAASRPGYTESASVRVEVR